MTDEQLAAITARAERTRAIRAPGYPLTPAEADREALLAALRQVRYIPPLPWYRRLWLHFHLWRATR